MKKTILSLLLVFPLLVSAQNGCNFFDFRKLEIEKVNLNTTQSDFGPSFVEDELWFSAFTDEEIRRLAKGDNKDIFYNKSNPDEIVQNHPVFHFSKFSILLLPAQ